MHVLPHVLQETTSSPGPRVYPSGFGKAILRLLPEVMGTGSGKPNLGPNPDGPQLLRDTPFTTWPEAALKPVLRYLRGNKGLELPERWKCCFPRTSDL